MSSNYCVIMAGGIGSRFWPMSRQHHPKQFIDILGTGETLLQATYRRVQTIFPPENVLVVTNEDYVDLVTQQLPAIPQQNILAEPMRKNTAPCIAYAAYKIRKRDPNAIMLITPADHLVTKEEELVRVLNMGIEYASKQDVLLTLGIKPTRPDTGYGYIQFSQKTNGENSGNEIKKVKTFTEKPELEMARHFMSSGEFLWNSGMFIWKLKTFMEVFEKHMPEEFALFNEGEPQFDTPAEPKIIEDIYQEVHNTSIDIGIMEKADNVYVIMADFGWSDLGTWGSLYDELKHKTPNAVVGKNVMLYDSHHCMVHVPKEKLVVIQGLENCIVAESNGVLLICKMEDEQKIKTLVNEVRIEKGEKFL
jgi:mannose-1-phosphate guanylyltransferase